MGYRIFPTHRLLKRDNVRRVRRRLKVLQDEYSRNRIIVEKIGQSTQSWIAHASHADTFGLRRQVLRGVTFRRR